MLGSMGLAAPIALGVALAQPKRRVFALEGDGSLLMQLGSLATIAMVAPRNLAIVVWDNGMYQITGSQKTATAEIADLVEMARGAGIAQSAWAKDEDDFERMIDRALNEDGPWFIGARTDAETPKIQTPREPVAIKDAFMRGLGVKPSESSSFPALCCVRWRGSNMPTRRCGRRFPTTRGRRPAPICIS